MLPVQGDRLVEQGFGPLVLADVRGDDGEIPERLRHHASLADPPGAGEGLVEGVAGGLVLALPRQPLA